MISLSLNYQISYSENNYLTTRWSNKNFIHKIIIFIDKNNQQHLNYAKDGNQRTMPGNATKPAIVKASAIKKGVTPLKTS
tara:strand:+ start:787 stop:1026 length:240 start_codon:yes stop_codon:yes gene_type:complete